MPRYVAFLRAINVGSHMVKMEQLRQLFGSLGLRDVETLIASGNVIFASESTDAESLERKIEVHLQRELGYEVKTFVRSAAEVTAISTYRPFEALEPGAVATLLVGFLKVAATAEAAATLMAADSDVDEFNFQGRELYWRCHGRMSDSKFFGSRLEKMLGQQTTIRNSNTVRRLAEKYPPTGKAKS